MEVPFTKPKIDDDFKLEGRCPMVLGGDNLQRLGLLAAVSMPAKLMAAAKGMCVQPGDTISITYVIKITE